ncbi:hypothetical protein FOL47_010724 [Perkinsus chesapeaki]|uniref:Uncharacterized protein n=1 Tax=Perkinsus chesapeaki TaxID=330153 RepID=A0A7J6L0S7_PERCH|nr:hypothetical protein FOL47_010724 [Perkinsus chesapeaki]
MPPPPSTADNSYCKLTDILCDGCPSLSTELLERCAAKLEGAVVSKVDARILCQDEWAGLHRGLEEDGYVLLSVEVDDTKGLEDPIQRKVMNSLKSGMKFGPGELDRYEGENGGFFESTEKAVRRLMGGDMGDGCWCIVNLMGMKHSYGLLADNSVNPLTKLIGNYFRMAGVTEFVTSAMPEETLLRCWSGYAVEDGESDGRLVVPRSYYTILTVVNVLPQDMVLRIEGRRVDRDITVKKGEVLAVTSDYSVYTVQGGGVFSCFTWPAKAYHTAEPLDLDVTLYRGTGPYRDISSCSNMRTVLAACPHCMRPIGLEKYDVLKEEEGSNGGVYAFVSLYYAPNGGMSWWDDGMDVVKSLQRLGRSLGEYCAGVPRVLLVAVRQEGDDIDEKVSALFEGCWDELHPVPGIYRNRWRFQSPHPKANPADTEMTVNPGHASQRCFDSRYPRTFGELTMLEALHMVEYDRVAYIAPNVEVRSAKFKDIFTVATPPSVAVRGISWRAKMSPLVASCGKYRPMGVLVFEPNEEDTCRLKHIIRECEHPAAVPSSNPAPNILTRYWATTSPSGVSLLPEMFVGEAPDEDEDGSDDIMFYDDDSSSEGSLAVCDAEDCYAYLHEWGEDNDDELKNGDNNDDE